MKKIKVGKIFVVVVVMLLLGMAVSSSVASAPQLRSQAPGYYRMMVGDIEITALFDGFFPLKVNELLKGASEQQLNRYLTASYQKETIPTSVTAYLVNTGSKLILIDAGCGDFYGATLGKVLNNLEAAGYKAEQVDVVALSHMHTDHLGGIVAKGKAVFPNAELCVDQKDADFWLNSENAKTADDQRKSWFKNAAVAVAPYQAAGKFKPFQGKTEVAVGVTAIPSYGHTPGHTAFSIESKGKKLLLVGDLFHVEAVQFPDPSIGAGFDSDMNMATAARKAIFAEAAKEGYLLGAAHLPFPGVGHVLKEGTSYRFLPLPYAPVE